MIDPKDDDYNMDDDFGYVNDEEIYISEKKKKKNVYDHENDHSWEDENY